MYRYWTPGQLRRLGLVGSLKEAGELAVEVLTQIRKEEQVIVQLCGPMTTGGLDSLPRNMERFARAIAFLEAHGICVFNQTPFQEVIIRVTRHHDGGPYCMDILEVFYRRIFESGHIDRTVFLPGWESSKGATWEREFVGACGIPVHDFSAKWLTQAEQ